MWSSRPGVHPPELLAAAPPAWAAADLHELAELELEEFDLPADEPASGPVADAAADPAALAEWEARTAQAAAEARLVAERAERERLLADAYARGYEEGRLAGEIAEGTRLRHAVASAEQALAQATAGEEKWAGVLEENLCALAVALARQLLGRELAADPALVADLVRRALAEFPLDQALTVRVHPLDLAALASAGAGAGAEEAARLSVSGGREVRWVADARVDRGGCMVEGRERIVDGRMDTALERLYRRLTYLHA
jgi:flagellar biosynthesis/type III secretory pathway protein FliH